jgi:glutamyl-tRNA synthetase
MGEEVREIVPVAERQAFIAAVRSNVLFPSEALDWARVIYRDAPALSEAARRVLATTRPGYIDLALQALSASPSDFEGFITRLKELSGERARRLFQPLRAAMTGRLDGPELAALFNLIGAERLRGRLSRLQ